MIDFLLQYYRELIALGTFLIELIFLLVLLFKKNKVESPILTNVLRALPSIIEHVEVQVGSGNGELKKSMVLDAISKMFQEIGLTFSSYNRSIVSEAIESILSAPQKKGK